MRLLDWLFGREKKPPGISAKEPFGGSQESPVGAVINSNSPVKETETAATPVLPAASPPAAPIARTLAHSQLLSRFLRPANPDSVTGLTYLESALGESCQSAIRGFILDGLLEPYVLSKEEHAQLLFKLTELKDLARERGLKLSGSKEELARRLLTADLSGISAIIAAREHRLVQCSAFGVAFADRYSQRRQAIEGSVETALREGKPEEAIRSLESFEAELGFARPDSERERRLREVRPIMSGHPRALHPHPELQSRDVRASAAMVMLGIKRSRDFPPDIEERINVLVSYGQNHRNLQSWRQSRCVRGVGILGSADGPCEECTKLHNRVWSLDDVPELPNPGCTTPGGCRCVYSIAQLVGQE
jgi:hypothetical protein